jgi:type IV fimbrial biogenesis protein FimT
MKNRIDGFTLLELLIVIGIVSILLIAGTGKMAECYQKQQIKSEASRLFHTLQYARLEAIKRNKMIIVSPMDDWSKGYIVYQQNSENKQILLAERKLNNVPIFSNKLQDIRYFSNGHSQNRGTFTIGEPHFQYKIVLYDSGRGRMEAPTA